MANSIPTYTKIPIPFANSGDKNSIPQNATGSNLASYSEGFPPITSQPITENGIPPEREDFNGLGFSTTNNISYLQQGGLYTFDTQLSSAIGGYAQGAILAYINNGQLYYLRSKINNNTYNFNTNSSYIGQYWEYASEQGGVSSVNNKTGVVNLTYSDVDAAPISHVSVEASTNVLGHVKIDGKSIQIDSNGVIKAIGGRGIGEIFAYPSALPPAGAFLLNGQTIPNCQEAYKEFWNWLTSQIGEYETVSIYKPWTQTPLTADGTIGGSDYAVEPSGTIVSGHNAWESFNMTQGNADTVFALDNVTSGYVTYYSPVPLRINSVTFTRATNGTNADKIISYVISGSNDNSTWTELASGDFTDLSASATLNIPIDSSKYSTNYSYKYYKFYGANGGGADNTFPKIYLYGEEFVRTMQESNGYIRAINAEEYEVEIAEYGACGAFVVSGSNVRLPNLSNAFIQGSNGSDIGKTMGAGLPNITGTFSADYLTSNTGDDAYGTGALYNAGNLGESGTSGSNGNAFAIGFDASLSNPIYGNSNTVQPLSAKYSICIQVFNTATDLSEQESAQLASQMQMKAQKDLGNVDSNIDFVVESWNDEQGNWYRVYKSGWVEQGGVVSKNGITITLFKPFASDNYNICICANKNSSSAAATNFYNRTTTSFYAFADVSAGNACWQASGQGAN